MRRFCLPLKKWGLDCALTCQSRLWRSLVCSSVIQHLHLKLAYVHLFGLSINYRVCWRSCMVILFLFCFLWRKTEIYGWAKNQKPESLAGMKHETQPKRSSTFQSCRFLFYPLVLTISLKCSLIVSPLPPIMKLLLRLMLSQGTSWYLHGSLICLEVFYKSLLSILIFLENRSQLNLLFTWVQGFHPQWMFA